MPLTYTFSMNIAKHSKFTYTYDKRIYDALIIKIHDNKSDSQIYQTYQTGNWTPPQWL